MIFHSTIEIENFKSVRDHAKSDSIEIDILKLCITDKSSYEELSNKISHLTQFSTNENLQIFGYLCADMMFKLKFRTIPKYLRWINTIIHENSVIFDCFIYSVSSLLNENKVYLKWYISYLNNDFLYTRYKVNQKDYNRELEKEYSFEKSPLNLLLGTWRRDCSGFHSDYDYASFPLHLIDKSTSINIINQKLNQVTKFYILNNDNIFYDINFITEALRILLQQKLCNVYQTVFILLCNALSSSKHIGSSDNILATDEEKGALLKIIKEYEEGYSIVHPLLLAYAHRISNDKDCDYYVNEIQVISKLLHLDSLFENNTTIIEKYYNVHPEQSIIFYSLLDDCKLLNYALKRFIEFIPNLEHKFYLNQHNMNNLFNTRCNCIARLFLNRADGCEVWNKLWIELYDERKHAMFPRTFTDKTFGSHSMFLLTVGVSVIHYLCDDLSKQKLAEQYLHSLWQAIKEIYLYTPHIKEDFIILTVFRIILFAKIHSLSYNQYVDFFACTPSIIVPILHNLSLNKFFPMNTILPDKRISRSISIYIKDEKNLTINHINECKQLLNIK